MKLKLHLSALLVVLLGPFALPALAVDPSAAEQKPPVATDAKKPAPNHVLVTISKETTAITKPLRKDGYPDYVTALNEIYGKDVTPENNAAVLLSKAIGPAPMRAKDRAEYFRLLGITIPDKKGDYFVKSETFVRKRIPAKDADDLDISRDEINKLERQFVTAEMQPWTRKECPLLAAYLDANEKPLDLAVEASRQPRFFDPLVVSEKRMLIAAKHELTPLQLKIGIGLLSRATLRLSEGKADAAWQDILAVHRLARLCGQGPMLADAFVAESLDGSGQCWSDHILLRYSRPSAADSMRMHNELAKLGPLPDLAEKIDRLERFTFLDAVASCARDRSASVALLPGGNRQESMLESINNQAMLALIDWDSVCRKGNSWYDRIVAALRKPLMLDQSRAIKPIESELSQLTNQAKSWTPSLLASPRRQVSDWIGNRLVSMLTPATMRVAVIENSTAMSFDLTKLAFSLAAYRADHGSYPAKLDELAPKYAAEIPKDVFTGGGLHYRPDGGGYLLYSVGENGKDDGGHSAGDNKEVVGWDDIVVRMPKSP